MPKPDEAVISHEQRAKRALEAGVPQIYFNGFVNALSSGDVQTTLERNGQPAAILNMSFTLAKTLAIALANAVSQFEEATGKTMLTTNEVETALRNLQKDQNVKEKKQ